jgi:hypothetical protein
MAEPFDGMSLKRRIQVKGDELTVCFAPSGEDRHTVFTTKDGKAELMYVWRRQ